jgi:hypothetical protein
MNLNKNLIWILDFLVFLSLLFGITITTLGIIDLELPKDLPWTQKKSAYIFLLYLIFCSVLIVIGSWILRISAVPIALLLTLVFIFFCGEIWPFVAVIWFILSSLLLGKFLLSTLKVNLENNGCAIQFLIGAGLYGTFIGLLAHFPMNYRSVYSAILTLPILIWYRELKEWLKSIPIYQRDDSYNLKNYSWTELGIGVLVLVYVVVALMPTVSFDALATHLFIPAHMALRHKWGFDFTTYVWSVTPMLPNWIFSILYVMAGETAVRLINVIFIFTLALLLKDLVIWGSGDERASRLGALLLLSTPLTFVEGSSLFIESVWASFLIMGLYGLLKVSKSSHGNNGWIVVSGIALGYALAAKSITLTLLPILLVILVWSLSSNWKAIKIKPLTIGFMSFLIFGGIPYYTAWYLTSNPVFPFFNAIFQSPYFDISNFDNPLFKSGFNFDTFYKIIFNSDKYMEATPGVSGFQWTLLLGSTIFILIKSHNLRGLTLFIIALLAMVTVFTNQSYLRYVFPSWVIFSAVIGIGSGIALSSTTKPLIRYVWGLVFIINIGFNLLFFSSGSSHRDFPLSALGSEQNREKYLSLTMPIRNAVEVINKLNLNRSPVAVFAHPLTAGLSSDALYANWYNPKFYKMINESTTEQEIAAVLLEQGVKFILLDENWNVIPGKIEFIKNIVEPIYKFGPISVNRFNSINHQFKKELLKNPNFLSMEGWSISSEGIHVKLEGVIQTSINAPATQLVNVIPGKQYLNSVTARCIKGLTLGRVQVNWMNQKGEFISTNIKTFECNSSFTKETLEVTAPSSARSAIIYATSHTTTPIEFKEVSFLK